MQLLPPPPPGPHVVMRNAASPIMRCVLVDRQLLCPACCQLILVVVTKVMYTCEHACPYVHHSHLVSILQVHQKRSALVRYCFPCHCVNSSSVIFFTALLEVAVSVHVVHLYNLLFHSVQLYYLHNCQFLIHVNDLHGCTEVCLPDLDNQQHFSGHTLLRSVFFFLPKYSETSGDEQFGLRAKTRESKV